MDLMKDALEIVKAGIAAVDPYDAVMGALRLEGDKLTAGQEEYDLGKIGRVLVLGAGKASAAMARAVEDVLGSRIEAGRVVVKYGHTAPTRIVELIEAGHPAPDAAGVAGTARALELADSAGENDLIICLFSGGGSALFTAPTVPIEDLAAMTRLLLECGADIDEINRIRKHLSKVKGGNFLHRAAPARALSLILSDVVGDRLGVIASAPTWRDDATFADALAVLGKYQLLDRAPESVVERLRRGARGLVPDTPKRGDPVFDRVRNIIIGSNIMALEAAARTAEDLGYAAMILSSSIEGETADAARLHAAVGREVLSTGNPIPPPCCILSGGETTVTIKGRGLGGRNQEFGLAAALAVRGLEGVVIGSVGTDGNDGPTDAAGALVNGRTAARALELGRDPADFLARNDSYNFFKGMDEHIITGPTNTNVMDIRIIIAGARAGASR